MSLEINIWITKISLPLAVIQVLGWILKTIPNHCIQQQTQHDTTALPSAQKLNESQSHGPVPPPPQDNSESGLQGTGRCGSVLRPPLLLVSFSAVDAAQGAGWLVSSAFRSLILSPVSKDCFPTHRNAQPSSHSQNRLHQNSSTHPPHTGDYFLCRKCPCDTDISICLSSFKKFHINQFFTVAKIRETVCPIKKTSHQGQVDLGKQMIK